MAFPGYAKDEKEILRECEAALKNITLCQASDGTKCAPNDSDIKACRKAMTSIYEYFELRNIKFF